MILEILTPETKVFSGEVAGVQLPGSDGLFEVLENHAPLVSALVAGNIKILKDKNTARSKDNTTLIAISGGFVEVLNNKVSVLAETAKPKS